MPEAEKTPNDLGWRKETRVWLLLNIVAYLPWLFPMFIWKFIWRCLDLFEGSIGAIARYVMIKHKLAECGHHVYVGRGVTITQPNKLSLGNCVSIQDRAHLITDGGISVGNNVSIAHRTSMVSTNHSAENQEIPIKYNPMTNTKITVHSDVWLGCNVTVLAGVTIGSRVIVAAGSVVVEDISGNCLAAGVPAKKVKAL